MTLPVLQTLRSASAAARRSPPVRRLPGATMGSPGAALRSAPPAGARVLSLSPLQLRIGLIVACVVSMSVAFHLGDPAAYLRADPALAHLLRGMALIKSIIVAAAAGAALWRLGWGVSAPVALAYVAGCAALAGSTMLIWQLTSIALAAVVFHGAALALLIVGWREA